jgi:hypothetical protein
VTDEPGSLMEGHWQQAEYETLVLPEPTWVEPLTRDWRTMRVAIGIPMERTMPQEAVFGFIRIFQHGWAYAQLPYTRNDIARHTFGRFLLDQTLPDGTPAYTHLLMLDSDHVHPHDIVQRLARWFQAYPQEVKVAGGLNFRRGAPYDPCAFVDPGDNSFHRISEWVPGLMEVSALGSGSMMIAREVFETLPEPWFDYQYPDHTGWPGTDMTFSARCREHGIKLWVDTTTVSPHIGAEYITEATYRDYIARAQGRTVLVTPDDAALLERVKAEAVTA